MKLLIQTNLLPEDNLRLIAQAVAEIPHVFVGVLPFVHEIISNEELVGTEYIPYGSTLLVRLAQAVGYRVSFNDAFNYQAALANRRDMLNQCVLTVTSAIEELAVLNTDVFIRPSQDLKQFSGRVQNSRELAMWLRRHLVEDTSEIQGLTANTEIVLNSPVNLVQEYRLFIVDRKIISGSLYRDQGQLKKARLEDPDLVRQFQEQFVDNQWLPDSCCVMDLAKLNLDQFKVIEFNCINCSGFYAADMQIVFSALVSYHSDSV